MKTLVAGWFSFTNGHATAGDLLVRDVACEWLEQVGCSYDVALAPPFQGGVDLCMVDLHVYSHIVFVCGPFERGELEAQLLSRFGHCRLIGLNLSMLLPLNEWNPFDLLIERDSSVCSHPDMAFLSRQTLVPVVGICRVEPYEGALEQVAHAAIARLVASREMAVVDIDTRLDTNCTGLRSPAEVESLIARMDVIVTTRLHGAVLALKNGVPAIAIDPIAGGAKIRRQAETIGWPVVFNADALTDDALADALAYCLTADARVQAKECAERATQMVQEMRKVFITALTNPDELNRKYLARIANPADNSWKLMLHSSDAVDLDSEPTATVGKLFKERIGGFLRFIVRDSAR
jgi:hypothetical protein